MCYFPAEVFEELLSVKSTCIGKKDALEESLSILTVKHEDSTWDHNTLAEFLADYRKSILGAHFYYTANYKENGERIRYEITVTFSKYSSMTVATDVSVTAGQREHIESAFEVFERNSEKALMPEPLVSIEKPVIFIGHGHGDAWRDLKDHLHEKHDYKIEAYETGARAGHSIRDILYDMAAKSSFALLVLTGDDDSGDGFLRARQNVVHETGLFQGRLGFNKAVVLLEDGVEEFSNLQGVQQIRFNKGNIKSTFGDVLATLKREFNQ